MKEKIFKIITTILTIIISFFMFKTRIYAIDECVWYSFESGIYYDEENNIYKPLKVYEDQSFEYKLTFSNKFGKDFKVSVGNVDDKFKDEIIRKQIKNSSKCPEYIGVQKNDALDAAEGNYKNYMENIYGNASLYDETYGRFSYNGALFDEKMFFTNVKTRYNKNLKLDTFDKETADDFKNKLTGLKDKDEDYHYKEDFYNSTVNIWSNAIDSAYEGLRENCSSYKNSESQNKFEYLDLIDYEKFPDFLDSLNYFIDPYEDSFLKTIIDEKCYNKALEAIVMQASFNYWFDLVDWLCLTKSDDKNNFDLFYKFYEFSHLSKEGGTHVRAIRESLNSREEGNKAIDSNNSMSNNRCNSLCYEYNPKFNSTYENSYSYEQCLLSSSVVTCNESDKKCSDKCKGTSSAYENCYNGCMTSDLGSDAYNKLLNNYDEERKRNYQNINDAIADIKDTLSRIEAPSLDIDFEPYKISCEDVEILHTFYVILSIFAPILVILFGTIDYAKAVIASDMEKMEKSKKNFPKRLGLLILFILVPIIIKIIIGIFVQDGTSLMSCIVNGQ